MKIWKKSVTAASKIDSDAEATLDRILDIIANYLPGKKSEGKVIVDVDLDDYYISKGVWSGYTIHTDVITYDKNGEQIYYTDFEYRIDEDNADDYDDDLIRKIQRELL